MLGICWSDDALELDSMKMKMLARETEVVRFAKWTGGKLSATLVWKYQVGYHSRAMEKCGAFLGAPRRFEYFLHTDAVSIILQ